MASVDDIGGAAGDRLRSQFSTEAERRLASVPPTMGRPDDGRHRGWWVAAAAVVVVVAATVTAVFALRTKTSKTVAPASSTASTSPEDGSSTPTTSTASTAPLPPGTRLVTAIKVTGVGRAQDICSAGLQALDAQHIHWDAKVLLDQSTDRVNFTAITSETPATVRWLFCTADFASSFGVIAMTSSDNTTWLTADVGNGPLVDPADIATAEVVDTRTATVLTLMPDRELTIDAASLDGGASWRVRATAGVVATTPTTSPIRSSATTLERGMIFGLRPGDAVDVDVEISRISGLGVGPPTLDSGWYFVPSDKGLSFEDCYGGIAYRVVWWKDIRLAFLRNGHDALWSWSVGDRNVIAFLPAKVEPGAEPSSSPSKLTTTDGVEVGARMSTIDTSKLSGPFTLPTGATDYSFEETSPAGPAATYIATANGKIIGYGSRLAFC